MKAQLGKRRPRRVQLTHQLLFAGGEAPTGLGIEGESGAACVDVEHQLIAEWAAEADSLAEDLVVRDRRGDLRRRARDVER